MSEPIPFILNPPKIGLVSLGCPKASYDSERIITKLRSEGYLLSADYAGADAVIVNTCGFLDSARTESLEAINEAIAENGKVIVTGCLGKDEALIREKCPGVIAVTGPQQYEETVRAVHDTVPPPHHPHESLVPEGGLKLTPRHYAYLKIAEGCDNKCSFCIIPSMRGGLRSRPVHEVLAEAERLKRAGVKELLIISQDTADYGRDLKYQAFTWRDVRRETRFLDLCQGLGDLGIWIRLHYVYPYPHIDHIFPLMAEGKILPYIDVPFQHFSPTVLKNMKRPGNVEKTVKRIENWRKIVPDLTIRSTFIVGFPGETEADFERLLDGLEEANIDRAGCFKYEAVTGATANLLPDPVPESLKEERFHRFMQKQQEISARRLKQKIGMTLPTIIDGENSEYFIGRSQGDAPEIDGQVFIKKTAQLKLSTGDITNAKITGSNEYDLFSGVKAL